MLMDLGSHALRVVILVTTERWESQLKGRGTFCLVPRVPATARLNKSPVHSGPQFPHRQNRVHAPFSGGMLKKKVG